MWAEIFPLSYFRSSRFELDEWRAGHRRYGKNTRRIWNRIWYGYCKSQQEEGKPYISAVDEQRVLQTLQFKILGPSHESDRTRWCDKTKYESMNSMMKATKWVSTGEDQCRSGKRKVINVSGCILTRTRPMDAIVPINWALPLRYPDHTSIVFNH